ncbi:hypothetical protein [Streptomyces sp. SID3343]|uniref:hypothetical protein n=1 Tax=Streptomyces sp. SID3343 TaxID=2690260 RepID=UPI0013685F7D|nr:hypothetical protein [Streptomyces sp. SID3343]
MGGSLNRDLAVWDGGPERPRGSTAGVVAQARAAGKDLYVLWPDGAARTRTSGSGRGTDGASGSARGERAGAGEGVTSKTGPHA